MPEFVVLMRGPSGSGKSTAVRNMCEELDEHGIKYTVCSADDYFLKDGEYKFDANQLRDAHGECFSKFQNALYLDEEPVDVVFVDNTNTTYSEMRKYIDEVDTYEDGPLRRYCRLRICEPSQNFSAYDLSLRNVHGVSEDVCSRQISRYEPPWKIILQEILDRFS